MTVAVGAPMPASLGLCADELHRVRELRLAMQRETDTVEQREKEIRDYIIDNLPKSQQTGAAGLQYRAQITVKPEPQIEDWSEFTFFIKQTSRFDLIQKRASVEAVKAMWEAGETIPGVTKFNKVGISLTKI